MAGLTRSIDVAPESELGPEAMSPEPTVGGEPIPNPEPITVKVWFRAARVEAFPLDGGACVKVGSRQIAVFNFARREEWYACQNLCPHKKQMVLSRGIVGSAEGVPKVACPLHKNTFSLASGECLSADLEPIRTYPVKVEDGYVLIGLGES